MKKILIAAFLIGLTASVAGQPETGRHRLVILADMGNEPDEEQQMMHLLMCSNEFELEGLIAVTGKFLQPANRDPYRQMLHPELFQHLIDGYEKVYPNLVKHASTYPAPAYLRSIVASGQSGYGITDTGEDKASEGSELILRALEKQDDRPLYIVVNAGSNTLAQALLDYELTHTDEETAAAVARLRVYENGAQDNAGAWICHHFPQIHWIRSNYQTYCYGGPAFEGDRDGTGALLELGPHTWQPYAYSAVGQHQWALEHIMTNHGAFGLHWPMRTFPRGQIHFVEGGGTIPWLCLVNHGLSDIDHPWWGGWSGRFTREKIKNYGSKHASVRQDEKAFDPFYTLGEATDTWINPEDGRQYDDRFAPVWRWRQAFFNDFACRMDWCTQSYEHANHHPVAAINGDISDEILIMSVSPGANIKLDATGSKDPDGDALEFSWWYYPEAGTYPGTPGLSEPDVKAAVVSIPEDASGAEIHIILEVKDLNNIASLWDYRRVVFRVQ
jgi:hypothetical protein